MTNDYNDYGIEKARIDDLCVAMLEMAERKGIDGASVLRTITYYVGHGKHTKRLLKNLEG